jgi:hypothetical protein
MFICYSNPLRCAAQQQKNIVQSGLFYNVCVCVCSTVLGSQVDPTIRLVLEEKEQALLALQETVEVHTHTLWAAGLQV